MRTALITFVVVIVLVLGFAFFVPHSKEPSLPRPTIATSSPPVVFIHDSYSKGTHTLTGSISVPTPCTMATAEASVVPAATSTLPDVITLTITMPPDTGICVQMIATTTFSTSVAAGKSVVFEATLNGAAASTTKN